MYVVSVLSQPAPVVRVKGKTHKKAIKNSGVAMPGDIVAVSGDAATMRFKVTPAGKIVRLAVYLARAEF